MADLTVTTTDTVTITGRQYGNTHEATITGINQVAQGKVNVKSSGFLQLMGFDSADQKGLFQFLDNTMKYFRLTNLDANNSVVLSISTTDGVTSPLDVINIEVPAGCSYVFHGDGAVGDGLNVAGSFTTSPFRLYRSSVRALSSNVDVEIFIATT
tara:strand:+ start:1227 stop:1691 length:465 start_codon:yes stop_codon:yes gene_type:complete